MTDKHYISPDSIKVTVAPTDLVVSVAELKTHLRVSHTDDDTYLQGVIKAAVKFVESYTRMVLPQTTFAAYYDKVDDLWITRTPIQSITSIQYYDYSDTLQTISTNDYYTDLNDFPARVWFDQEFEVYTDRPAACIVTFVAGYANVANIDDSLKHVIKMIAADMYDQRMNSVVGTINSKAQINYGLLLTAWRKDYFA